MCEAHRIDHKKFTKCQTSRVKTRLQTRPGARYTCAGDGLCCTDIHALGPVTAREARALRAFDPTPVERHRSLDMIVVRPASGKGVCQFLDGLTVGGLCTVHARAGELAKPSTCRRFPLGLTMTPEGGRITTDHRCPCRTMGDRPVLTVESARGSISDRAGRPVADTIVGKTIALTRTRRVAFSTYTKLESEIFGKLATHGVDALFLEHCGHAAHGSLPALDGVTWVDVAHWFRGEIDGTSGGEALVWFGDAILSYLNERERTSRSRPWSAAFDRAEARSTQGDVDEIESDWVADVIWSMRWTELGPFDLALHELRARVIVGREIYSTLTSRGVRPDRAMGETLCVIELVGATDLWAKIVNGSMNAEYMG